MAAPIASKIILPLDTANSGPKVQTQTEVIGANIVHAHYFIQRSRQKLFGIYGAVPTVGSVQASAQNVTSSAFWWLQMPVGGTVRARLRRLALAFTIAGEADMQSVPRIAIARFTFTGTASGAVVTPSKRKSSDATPTAILRTAMTGMVITLDALLWAALVPTFGITTSGAAFAASAESRFDPTDEEDFFDIGAGEGLALYQPDAGTASDTRRFLASLAFDEYDAA